MSTTRTGKEYLSCRAHPICRRRQIRGHQPASGQSRAGASIAPRRHPLAASRIEHARPNSNHPGRLLSLADEALGARLAPAVTWAEGKELESAARVVLVEVAVELVVGK